MWINNKNDILNRAYKNGLNNYLHIVEITYKGFKSFFYDYEEMKLIAEGEFIISDESGKEVHAKVGDVFYFGNGETITFSTPSRGVGFFVGQRKPL